MPPQPYSHRPAPTTPGRSSSALPSISSMTCQLASPSGLADHKLLHLLKLVDPATRRSGRSQMENVRSRGRSLSEGTLLPTCKPRLPAAGQPTPPALPPRLKMSEAGPLPPLQVNPPPPFHSNRATKPTPASSPEDSELPSASPAVTPPPFPTGQPNQPSPDDSERVPPVAADLLPEAGGVAHILDGQVLLLKPPLAVQRAQGLLAGGNQVLVVALACSRKG